MKFGFHLPGGFWIENVQRVWTTDGRRRASNGACLYFKLTHEPKRSGELIEIFHGCEVYIEEFVPRVTVHHHKACSFLLLRLKQFRNSFFLSLCVHKIIVR